MNKHSELPGSRNQIKVSQEEFYNGGKRKQYFSALAVNLGSFAIGNAWSWSATALPLLEEDSNFSEITESEMSWIASIIFIGAAAACPIMGFVSQKWGLRFSMLSLTLPLVAGWFLIAFANNFWMLLAGRFITGFCAGGVSLAAPAFIAETTIPSIRGKLSFAYFFNFSCGVLYIFLLGSLLSYKYQSLACILAPIVFHILLSFIPESPRYLLTAGKDKKAAVSLMWFRMAENLDQIAPELNNIQMQIDVASKEREDISWLSVLTNRSALHPILIAIGLQVLLQLCGEVPVLAYTVDIFKAAGTSDGNMGTIIVGVTQMVTIMVASFFVDKLGRKPLLILSEVFMSLSLIALGVYVYLKDEKGFVSLENYNWIPIMCLIIFISAFAVGVGPIPWVAIGELIAPEVKGYSSGIITIVNRILGFFALFFFTDLISLLGQHGCYWLFAAVNILGIFYVLLFVPETKGKSLEDIQAKLATKILFITRN